MAQIAQGAAVETRTRLTIVNPVAEGSEGHDGGQEDRFPPAPRPVSLDGKVVALFWNGKPQGEVALARVQANLSRRFPTAGFVEVLADKGSITRFASEGQRDELLRTCDAVVGTSADCGSCTSWLIKDMAALERRGMPSVALTASGFVEDAQWSAKIFGCEELPLAEVPLPLTNQAPDSINAMIDAVTEQIVRALTADPHDDFVAPAFDHITLVADRELDYRGDDLLACWERMNEEFVSAGWSDGLPLVAPTAEKVEAMVNASGLAPDSVVGVFAPGMGIGTVEKIAANAVMAGCRPNTMPVVLAMAECILDPRIGLRTFAMSTGPQAPVVMVSGSIAAEIGMNNGVCALGPGSISAVNVVIGRALRLIMMNVGHCYPGVSDMDTIGSSLKFSACVAENEERNPWEPFRVLQGHSSESSTVTVNVPYGVVELFDFLNHDPLLLVETFATVMRNSASTPQAGSWLIRAPSDPSAGFPFHGLMQNLIMLCPDHAAAFAAAGWSVRDIKEALHKACRLPFSALMLNKPQRSFQASHPNLSWLEDQPETLVGVFPNPDCFEIFVVGADAGRSLYFPGGSMSITREVKA